MWYRFFVLENLLQDVILGRLWERLVRAKHNNRDDGSCYTTIYDKHRNTVTFCSVSTYHERNRAETKFVTSNPQESCMALYACDRWKVILDTDNEEVQVNNEGNMFMVKYKVNRVTVIDNFKSHVRELYTTIRYINRTDRQNELYGSIRKRKKAMEALTLYKRKKNKILPANQPYTVMAVYEGSRQRGYHDSLRG